VNAHLSQGCPTPGEVTHRVRLHLCTHSSVMWVKSLASTFAGIMDQISNRVYRLEIQSFMLVFSTPLVNYRPSNLLTGTSIPPLPCVNKYRGTYLQIVCNRGGREGVDRGPQTDEHLPPNSQWSIFKKSRHSGFGVFIDI
jgi:hypothetical protein